jgi:predicted N-acyltransferase
LYYDNTEIIKIKGFDSKNINFNDLSTNFYAQKNITQETKIMTKRGFELKQDTIFKLLNLNFYDKRTFIENFKNTKPIIYSIFND